jgi:SAM-dependent methyltransferase
MAVRSAPALSETLQAEIAVVAAPWKGSPYYDDAERMTFLLWSDVLPFHEQFKQFDLANVLELSCGHGRHAEITAPKAERLTLVDVLDENIAFCRDRLSGRSNVAYLVGDGATFGPVADASLTAIYCYDSMVHFSPEIVASYIRDTARVLAPGGRAIYHHSNYQGPAVPHYGMNPHARNFMSQELFVRTAKDAGLEVVASRTIDWGNAKDLDCMTVLQKPVRRGLLATAGRALRRALMGGKPPAPLRPTKTS